MMKLPKTLHVGLVVWMAVYLAAPKLFASPEPETDFPIERTVQHVTLQSDGSVKGMLVDSAGRGVPDAPVVIGMKGKPLADLRTNEEGRFVWSEAKAGVFQVVTHGGAVIYQVWDPAKAPEDCKQGIVRQVDPAIARGADSGGLMAWLTNPIFLALLIAAAIAIPLALDDDDDPAS